MKPVHDQTASVVSLAKTMRMSLDRRKVETSVRTESLILVLETFLALAQPGSHQKIADSATRSVSDLVRQIENASQRRDEDRAPTEMVRVSDR
jgi:hypothetical protein